MWYICLYPQIPHLLTSLFFVSSITYVQLPRLSFPPRFLVFALTSPLEWSYGLCCSITGSSTTTTPGDTHLLLSYCAAPPSDAVDSSWPQLSPYRYSFPSHQHSKSKQIQSISSDALISTFSQGLALHHLVYLVTSKTSMKEVINCRENCVKNLSVRWYRKEDDTYL